MMAGALAMVLICTAAWAFAYRTMVRHPLDFAAITLYLSGYQMIFRPFVVASGWDAPFPQELFRARDIDSMWIAAQRLIVIWLICVSVGYVLGRMLASSPPSPTEDTPLELHVTILSRIMIVFTIIATLITLWLWGRYGGFSGLITSNKLDKDLLSLQWLRSFTVLSTFVAGATYLAAVASGRRGLASIAFGLAIVNGTYSFSWGARDAIAITTFGLLAGRLLFNRNEVGAAAILPSSALSWWRRRRRIFRLMLTVVLLASSVFFLRITRDALVFGETLGTIESQTPIRQLAVSTNNTDVDTLTLLVEDWPERQEHTGGQQFFNALTSFVPGFLYQPDEGFRPPAVEVAQYYRPNRENGWPMTPIGDWYIAWGALGVVIGGLISGAVIRVVQVRLENFSRNPLVWMLSVVLAIRVLPMGVWANSAPRLMTFALPAALVVIYVQRRRPEELRAQLDPIDDAGPVLSDADAAPTPAGAEVLADIATQVRAAKNRRLATIGSSAAPIEIERRPSPRRPPAGTTANGLESDNGR